MISDSFLQTRGAIRWRLVSLLIAGLALCRPALGQDLLLVTNPAALPDDHTELAFHGAAFAGNDMVPVSKFDAKPWPLGYHTNAGANLAVANGRLDLGASRGGLHLGYFYREDWWVEGGRDTVDAFALSKRNQLVGQNRNFSINYQVEGFSADGLRLGYSGVLPVLPHDRLVWGLSVSLLRGLSVRRDSAAGELMSGTASSSLLGNRVLYNSRQVAVSSGSSFNAFIPPQVMDVPTGSGYGLDVGLTWLAANGAKVSLAANDLAGSIRWERVPLIEQNVNYTGDFQASPSLSGRNVYAPLRMTLSPKYQLVGEYPVGRWTWLTQVESEKGYWFPQVGLGFSLLPDWRMGVDYGIRFQSFGVSLTHRNYYCRVSTEDLNLARSRALGVAAGLRFLF